MPDLTKGYSFIAGEIVTPAKLHALVENAEIKAGAVGTTELADGSVTAAKLASNVALTASAVQLASGKVLVGTGSNIGGEVPVDTGSMTTASSFGVKDAGVTTAKLADGAVTLAKMATQAANTVLANATGSAVAPTAVALGTGLEFSGGLLRVTPAVISAGVTKFSGTAAVPAKGALVPVAHGLGTLPGLVRVYLECLVDTLGYLANTGSGNPSRVPIEHLFSYDYAPAFSLNVTDSVVEVIRYDAVVSSDVYLLKRTAGGIGIGRYDTIHTDIATNWRLRVIAWA